jgi:hypothetical protein
LLARSCSPRRRTSPVAGTRHFLDLTALGRQEDWEEPKGRATGPGAPAGSDKILYPDEYGNVTASRTNSRGRADETPSGS